MEPLRVSELLRSSLEIYRRNLRLFISISLLLAISIVALLRIFGTIHPESFKGFVFMTCSTLLSSWFSMAMMYAAILLLKGRKIDFKQALRMPRERYFHYVTVNAALFVLVICGAFLFVLPGIYLGVLYNFASTVTVFENTDLKASFLKSAYLVKGYFFNILGFFAIVVMLALLPDVLTTPIKESNPSLALTISRILSTLVIPFIIIAQMALYLRMQELKSSNHL